MNLEIFKKDEFGEIRVVDMNNEPWFVAKDICDSLNLLNVTDSLKRLDDDEKLISKLSMSGQNRDVWVINESGLYSLVLSSNKLEAKKFKKWITGEVLPTIRKHGIYATDSVIDNILNNPDFGIELLTKLKDERKARVEAEKTVTILTHCNKTYTTTEIAKELDMKSARELNQVLSKRKVQYKQGKTWVLYSKFASLGYVNIKQEVQDSGYVVYDRRWTGMGREFLIKLLTQTK